MKTGDLRTWTWTHALERVNEAERLHKLFFHRGRSASRCLAWEPPIDIFESNGDLHVVVALPGARADRLKVFSEGTALVITGELSVPWGGHTGPILRMEIPHGPFERRVEGLPQGLRIIRNELCDGCLFLSCRKGEGP